MSAPKHAKKMKIVPHLWSVIQTKALPTVAKLSKTIGSKEESFLKSHIHDRTISILSEKVSLLG